MSTVIPPWGQSSARNWARAAEFVLLTDMTAGLPASAFSPHFHHGRWKAIPYETVDRMAGTMIWASPLTDAPEVRIPLDVTGWHAIFIGLFSTSEAPSFGWFRLASDPAPVARSNRSTHDYGNIAELFLKAADVQPGETLVIRPEFPSNPHPCGVAWVRLIPLSEAEIEGLHAERADRSSRRMVATHDGFSASWLHRPTTADQLLSQIEFLRDTDFGTLILQSFGADRVSYRSKHGHLPGMEMSDFPRTGDRNFVESARELDAKGIHPLQRLIDGAHQMGLKVHVGIRPAGWSFFEPYTEFWETPFYREHPEWRCIDRDGTTVTRMSWAVPEVRRHLVDLLDEMVGFGADGAHLVFNRGFPLTLFEPPFVEMFHARFGIDPHTIEETDLRITDLRVEIATSFMEELRARLDDRDRTRADGKRTEISAMVLGNEEDNLRYGLDVRRLVDHALLDEIHIYPWDFGGVRGTYDLAFFRQICAARQVPFHPALDIGRLAGKELLQQGIDFYNAGASGITVFDAENLAEAENLPRWVEVARFGHREEMLARLVEPPSTMAYTPFHRLGDQIRDGRYGPFWGG
jgi:hypothetical protein